MQIMSRPQAVKAIRDQGRKRGEQAVDLAQHKLNDIEAHIGQLAKTIEQDAWGWLDQGSEVAAAKISEAESKLRELRGMLPTEQKKHSSAVQGFVFVTMLVSGATLAAIVVRKLASQRKSAATADPLTENDWSGSSNQPASYAGPTDPFMTTNVYNLPANGASERANGKAKKNTSAVATPELSGVSAGTAAAVRMDSLLSKDVVDSRGDAVGSVERVYYRGSGFEPEWAAVSMGLTDKKTVLAPLADATIDEAVQLAYPKELVTEAPELNGADALPEDTEMAAYRHYNLRREVPGETIPSSDESEARLISWPQHARSTT